MDSDILIKTIVERVLSELQKDSSGSNKTHVMVLSAYSKLVEEQTLKCLNANDVELHFLGDSHPVNEMARYVIPQLSCGDMAELASGQAKGPMTEAVLQLLLEGTAVEVLDYEYKAYENTAAPGLYKLYMQHESTLSSFGLTSFKPESKPIARCWQKLIAEKDVEQAAHAGVKEMHVIKESVITPLAMEQAKLSQINIYKNL
ncbi:hypothetical protein [Moritella yayanosii]|uniref:Uncharacterized protein n=1 Tax=Moritella yayanosii TaxID=69539 RepID=A0A330LRY1_9GAMM|nr:hypothetical protein [Moritella yayanosii]SQD78731.1 conserved protein of unknown function, might belong to ethanolamine utilization protein [Moritella yayanosii]